MQKINRILLIVLIFMMIGPDAYPSEKDPNKHVLILFAMVPSSPAYRVIADGIRNSLTEAYGDNYNLHMEYLEAERYPKGEYPKERFDLYNEKYSKVDLDLLICVGIDIIETIKARADEHLLNLPAISIDYDFSMDDNPKDITLNRKTTVFRLIVDAEKIISEALHLFPGTESIYFFCGTAPLDKVVCSITQQAVLAASAGKKISFFTDMSMDEILTEVRQLPDNSIVIVPNFTADNKHVVYFNPESIRLISRNANSPVFCFNDMGFGEGAVGGYLLSFKKIGTMAGEAAVKIIKGADPGSIKINETELYEYKYDWRELKRWDLIGSDLIPKGSKILFEETGFFKEFRLIILAALIFVIIQSLLIIKLVSLYRKQRQITGQLIVAENKYRELIREDRILRLSQLTASLSHELNQPLTAILSTAQAGIRFIDSNNMDHDLMKELFQNIAEDDKRTASILSSIRGMLKLERREKERLNLNMLIEEIITIYRSESTKKGIRLEVNLPDQPVCIVADPIQIQQVIMNLIMNAMQSIEKAQTGKRLIIISEVSDDESVTVSLRDYGEGITESVKDRLFKPFVTSKQEGTGIGLSISRSIIDEHQGEIWAENMPDGGANFAFRLKKCKDEPASH
jgi:signal transduction histidine kinase